MTPEQEISRIKRDYKEHWHQLENLPAIKKAISEKNPTKLGELVAQIVHGNRYMPLTDEEMEEYDHHAAFKRREKLIAEKKKSQIKMLLNIEPMNENEQFIRENISSILSHHQVKAKTATIGGEWSLLNDESNICLSTSKNVEFTLFFTNRSQCIKVDGKIQRDTGKVFNVVVEGQ